MSYVPYQPAMFTQPKPSVLTVDQLTVRRGHQAALQDISFSLEAGKDMSPLLAPTVRVKVRWFSLCWGFYLANLVRLLSWVSR